MEKRRIQIAAIAVAAGMLVMTLLIVLPLLVRPESFRGMLQQELSLALKGRKVVLGPISLDLWPGVGLRVERFEVDDLAPGRPFIRSGRLVIRASFWQLLRRRLAVHRMDLESAQVSLVRGGPNNWNFSDLARPTAQADGQIRLTIRTLVITDARFELSDETGQLSPATLAIDRLVMDEVRGMSPMIIEADGGIADSAGSFHLEALYGPLAAIASARAVEFSLSFRQLDLAAFLAFVPHERFPLSIRSGLLSGSISGLPATGSAVLDVDIDLAAGAVSYTNAAATWPHTDTADFRLIGHARFDRGSRAFSLSGAQLSAAGNTAALDLTSQPAPTGSATSIRLRLENGNIPGLLALAPALGRPLTGAGLETSGTAGLAFDYRGETGLPAEVDLALDLSAASLAVPELLQKPAGTTALFSSHFAGGDRSTILSSTIVTLGPLTLSGGGAVGKDDFSSMYLRLEGGPAASDQLRDLVPALSRYAPGGQVTLGVEVTGRLSVPESIAVRVFKLEQKSPAAALSANVGVRLSRPRLVEFELAADTLDLNRVLGPARPDPRSQPGQYTATGRFSIAKLFYRRAAFSTLTGSVDLRAGRITIPDLKAGLLGGTINGPLSFDLSRAPRSGSVALGLAGVDAEGLLANFTAFPAVLSGRATGSISIAFTGAAAADLKKSARGSGKLSIEAGALAGVDLANGLAAQWVASSPVRQLAGESVATVRLPAANRTRFDSLAGDFTIALGRVWVQRSSLSSADLDAELSGSLGLDQSVDVTGVSRLSRPATERLLAELERQIGRALSEDERLALLDDGRLAMPFTLKGEWPAPALTFDAGRYVTMIEESRRRRAEAELRAAGSGVVIIPMPTDPAGPPAAGGPSPGNETASAAGPVAVPVPPVSPPPAPPLPSAPETAPAPPPAEVPVAPPPLAAPPEPPPAPAPPIAPPVAPAPPVEAPPPAPDASEP